MHALLNNKHKTHCIIHTALIYQLVTATVMYNTVTYNTIQYVYTSVCITKY